MTSNPSESSQQARVPWFVHLVPFILSACTYLSAGVSLWAAPSIMPVLFIVSALLAAFSPLPLLLYGLKVGRKWAWFAAAVNLICVALLSGDLSAICFFVFVVVVALSLLEGILRKQSLERMVSFTFGGMFVLGIGLAALYSLHHHVHPIGELRTQIDRSVEYLAQSMPSNPVWTNASEVDELKRNLLVEFPSNLGIFAFFLVLGNLLLLLRLNPAQLVQKLGLDSTFMKRWKTPQFLVWPTIVTGFFLLSDFGLVSDIAKNLFNFLMAIYVVQGLSILSYFFDVWSLRGVFRGGLFVLSIFLMMPFVLSLGFFDLWFDFRSKFRQS